MGAGVSRNEAKRITRKREFLAIVERASFRADQFRVRNREEQVTDEE